MNFIIKIFKKQLIKYIVKMLESNKDSWADDINLKVDFPGLDEKEEKKMINASIEVGICKVKEILEKV